MRVEEIMLGACDPVGRTVQTLYARHAPDYAVYAAGDRVIVQLADDPARPSLQLATLAGLGALRAEVDALAARSGAEGARAGLGFALAAALQGDLETARADLQALRDRLGTERTARRARQALAAAAVCAVVAVALVRLGLSPAVVAGWWPNADVEAIRAALGAGALGAAFSIAVGTRRADPPRDATDAVLRVLLGVLGAGVVLAMHRLGLLTSLGFDGGARLPDGTAPETVDFVLGFAAGFSERLAPDVLARLAPGGAGATSEAAVAAAEALTPRPGSGCPDDCLCDAPPLPGEPVTSNHALPPSLETLR